MDYQCELQKAAPQPAVSIRTWASVQELPKVLGQSFAAVAQYLAEKGEQPAGPVFVAYYNMDMQNLDIEAGFPVARELEGRGAIRSSEIPGGDLASCVFTGPYSDMVPAYEALKTWVEGQGREPTGVSYEIYLNDPQTTPQQELQTRIIFPLK